MGKAVTQTCNKELWAAKGHYICFNPWGSCNKTEEKLCPLNFGVPMTLVGLCHILKEEYEIETKACSTCCEMRVQHGDT